MALQWFGDDSSVKQLEESETVESEYLLAQGEQAKVHGQGPERIVAQCVAVEVEYPLAQGTRSRRCPLSRLMQVKTASWRL